jgi:DNA-directed RNA polymerase subunit M/transcription elongation factor TFIIS
MKKYFCKSCNAIFVAAPVNDSGVLQCGICLESECFDVREVDENHLSDYSESCDPFDYQS